MFRIVFKAGLNYADAVKIADLKTIMTMEGLKKKKTKKTNKVILNHTDSTVGIGRYT